MIRKAMTEYGEVRGIPAADPRITAFKGIPFAAPPVGENRWRAPQPCSSWSGVKDTIEFAPISIQDTPGIGDNIYVREWHVDTETPMSEDCLYLNVWTGAKSTEERLPVVIWFFGGALQWGYPSEMEFDGERLARRGIIVVSVNYRLGALGFLAHPDLTREQPEAPTNFGHLDQQAGLNWVIRNIHNFGGDKENITIAGQSAGAGSVMTQLTCPANNGKFQRAIVQSGIINSPYEKLIIGPPPSLTDAEGIGVRFFNLLSVSTLEQARALDPYYIRAKYAEFRTSGEWMLTVQDNIFCVGHSYELFLNGERPDIPVMAGRNTNEFPTSIHASNKEEYIERVHQIFGSKADQFLTFNEAQKVQGTNYATIDSLQYGIKALLSSNSELGFSSSNYSYIFDADIPGFDHPGNFHSVELWFFFETLAKCWRPFHGAHYDLARKMSNYWTNFVKRGNPNGNDHDGTPMPIWKPYQENEPSELLFTMDGPKLDESLESEFSKFMIQFTKRQFLK